MTLEEAKEIREKYFKIIGMTGDTDAEIADVIIEPLGKDLLVNFRILYSNLMRGDETVNNDKRVKYIFFIIFRLVMFRAEKSNFFIPK